jgi:holo-[acyl-carrier protein] synthase
MPGSFLPVPRVGTDLVEIARFARALARHGARLERRLFTPGERADCRARPDPASHFAVRFAAKEAVLKLLGTGWGRGVGWTDVEIGRGSSGAPEVRLHGRARVQAAELGIGPIAVSMSHSGRDAMAVAAAIGR